MWRLKVISWAKTSLYCDHKVKCDGQTHAPTHWRTTAFLHVFPLQRCCEVILNGLMWQWCQYKWDIYEFIKYVMPMSWLLSSSMAVDQIEHVTFVYTYHEAKLYLSFEIISYFSRIQVQHRSSHLFPIWTHFFCNHWMDIKEIWHKLRKNWKSSLYFSCWSVDKYGHSFLWLTLSLFTALQLLHYFWRNFTKTPGLWHRSRLWKYPIRIRIDRGI